MNSIENISIIVKESTYISMERNIWYGLQLPISYAFQGFVANFMWNYIWMNIKFFMQFDVSNFIESYEFN